LRSMLRVNLFQELFGCEFSLWVLWMIVHVLRSLYATGNVIAWFQGKILSDNFLWLQYVLIKVEFRVLGLML
jgi:hypothetical protein